jgi:hypothetical protein
MITSTRSTALAVLIVGAVASGASAQAPSQATEPSPTASTAPAPVPSAPAVALPLVVPPAATQAPDDFDLSSLGLDPSSAFDDKLYIYGFADFTYESLHFGGPSVLHGTMRGFRSGNLNVYLAKNLTPKWRSLAEVRLLFAPNGSTNADGSIISTATQDANDAARPIEWGGIRIERAYVEYDVSSKLTIRAGHWLTPYGIWNTDHGSPTIISTLRPYVIGEQFIPEHQTGIDAFGTTYVGEYRIGYHATVSNGRSPAEAIRDPDGRPAFGGRLELGAPWSGTVNLGASVYAGRSTRIAANVLAVPVSDDEVSAAADAQWRHGGLLVQGEIMVRDCRFRVGQRPVKASGFQPDGDDLGGYALVGYRFDRMWNVMPFALYEHYQPLEQIRFRESAGYGAGVNFRPTPTVVLKAMATAVITEGAGVYGTLGTLSIYSTQIAWVF